MGGEVELDADCMEGIKELLTQPDPLCQSALIKLRYISCNRAFVSYITVGVIKTRDTPYVLIHFNSHEISSAEDSRQTMS